MDDKGYSITTQDKLKEFCKKNSITLGLTNYDPTINHDDILEIINYCSLGDYDDCVALVLEVFRFRNNTLMSFSQSQQFLKYFLRTYFIYVRIYMESDKSNDLQVLRGSLDAILQHVRGVYHIQGIIAIDEYMKTQCERLKGGSTGILEQFKTLQKQLS